MKYAKVRTIAGPRLIQISSETDTLITGYRVTRDGTRWSRELPDGGEQQEIVYCTRSAVIERLTLDPTYCELVPEVKP